MPKTSKGAATETQEASPAPATESPTTSTEPDASGDTTPSNAKADNPLDDIGVEMPSVQQHAVDAHRADTQADAAKAETATKSGAVDSQGRAFNPDLHEHDANVPRLTSTGKLRCWRGGKSSSQKASQSRIGGAAKSGDAPGSTPAHNQVDLEAKIQSTAAVTAQLIFTAGQALGGEEWAPRKRDGIDEPMMMQSAWAEYYRAHGVTDLPPWAGVAIAMCAYTGPRFFMPKTQSRLGKFKEWMYGAIGRWRARRSSARRETNMRNDVQSELGT